MASGAALTRSHQLDQIANSASVVAMLVELARRWRLGQISDNEFVVGGVGIDLLGFRGATRLASDYLIAHRSVVAPELLDIPLALSEFDQVMSVARAQSTLQALRVEQDRSSVQRLVDLEFDRIVGRYAAWGQKAAMMAGRDLLIASSDQAGTRFRRVSDGNPCSFCAMLVARGPVYRSRESAARVVGRASGYGTANYRATGQVSYQGRKRGKREIGERFHNHCGCTVEEVAGEWTPTTRENEFVDLYDRAVAKLDSDGLPHSRKHVLATMRDLGQGVIHDAHQNNSN